MQMYTKLMLIQAGASWAFAERHISLNTDVYCTYMLVQTKFAVVVIN